MFSDRPTITKLRLLTFLIRRVPLVLYCGIRLKRVIGGATVVTMKRNWRNRNPYNGAYFASILAGAEMATGVVLFDEMSKEAAQGVKLAAFITSVEAEFHRPLTSEGTFVCDDNHTITKAVERAKYTKVSDIPAFVTVYNARAKKIATVTIRWRIVKHK